MTDDSPYQAILPPILEPFRPSNRDHWNLANLLENVYRYFLYPFGFRDDFPEDRPEIEAALMEIIRPWGGVSFGVTLKVRDHRIEALGNLQVRITEDGVGLEWDAGDDMEGCESGYSLHMDGVMME